MNLPVSFQRKNPKLIILSQKGGSILNDHFWLTLSRPSTAEEEEWGDFQLSDESQTLEVRITAPSSGSIYFLVRATFSDSDYNLVDNDPWSSTGYTDDQGHDVRRYRINVNPPPKTDTRFDWVRSDPSPMIKNQQGRLESKLEDDTLWHNDLQGKTVRFYVNNSYIGSGITDVQGEAYVNYTPSTTSSFTLKTVFEGDSSYNSCEESETISINEPPKTDTRFDWVRSDPSPMIKNQQGRLESKLEDDTLWHNDLQGKTVKFYVNNSYIGSGITDVQGEAYVNYTPSTTSSFTLKTVFEGDSSYNSCEESETISINEPPKTDTRFDWVRSDPSPMIKNQQGRLESKLEDDTLWHNDLQGKTVKFYVNNSYIGSDITDVQGEAYVNYTPSTTSSFTLKTVFEGDSSYNSCEESETISINEPPKTDTRFDWVRSDPSPMIKNQQGRLESKLEDDTLWHNDLQGKTVKFYVNNSYIGSDITDVQGEAYVNYTPSTTSSFTLKTVFEGDSSYNSCEESETISINEPPNQPPTIPGEISTSDITETSATVSWEPSSDPDSVTITYEVQYQKDDLNPLWSSSISTINAYLNLSGLDSDTDYHIQVKATDGNGGESDWQKKNFAFKTLIWLTLVKRKKHPLPTVFQRSLSWLNFKAPKEAEPV